MSNLLQIASRVEAAVEAYTSVREFADKEEWKAQFDLEMVSDHLHGNRPHYRFEIGQAYRRIFEE
jgi:hypothetical protein